MLRVRRGKPPSRFHDEVERPRDALLHWARRPADERSQRRAPIRGDMFRAGALVGMVASDFDGRCAYCEAEVGTEDGIDHLRPVHLADEDGGGTFVDHYSWLAFEWRNLFLICLRCRKARADRFPVLGRRARFLATEDETRAEERPLLLDPTSDNPSVHLSYLMTGECFPRADSVRGNATAEVFDLNADPLVHERRRAVADASRTWRSALEGRDELPEGFLLAGPFPGACRDVVTRTLGEYGTAAPSINRGRALLRQLRVLLEGSDADQRGRLVAAIDSVEGSDRVRSSELARRAVAPVASRRSGRPAGGADAPSTPRGEVEQVRVTNLGAIDEVSVPIPRSRTSKSGASCLLLLGENAVGKSTFLAGTALALLGTRQARALRLSFDDLVRSVERDAWDVWGRLPSEVEVNLAGSRPSARFRYDPVRRVLDGTAEQSAVVLGYGPHRYLANARGRRGVGAAQGVRSLFDPQRPLPDPSGWLSDLRGTDFDQVARTIRTVLPIGDDDHLVNDPRDGICVSAQGQLTPVTRLSEGYRSVFAMVADMCRSLMDHWRNLETAEGVVLIDEVETHLHPRWKMRVVASLREAFPRVQFIITSHDPLCVRGMDDGEVVVLARDEGGGVHLVQDLPSISGMRAEQILTSEYFGLASTVDPELHLDVARLAQGVDAGRGGDVGVEAAELISRITVGDSAAAQVIHEALVRYLRERGRPAGDLSTNARADAVAQVFKALRASRAGLPG